MRVLLVLCLTLFTHISEARCGAPASVAEPTAWQTVTFSMEPRVTGALPWEVKVTADGVGSYRLLTAEAGAPQRLQISPGTLKTLGLGQTVVATGACETRHKNIARTGRKTLAYETAAGVVSCGFDYSDDEGLMDVAAAFQAVVETLQYGERLQHERRFDRLSLDAEMQSLTSEIALGRAIEVGNIAGTLQALVDDDRVIDRVRRAAARLLEKQVVEGKE
jgi:hypothetical protein